jgi:hypothetical protein
MLKALARGLALPRSGAWSTRLRVLSNEAVQRAAPALPPLHDAPAAEEDEPDQGLKPDQVRGAARPAHLRSPAPARAGRRAAWRARARRVTQQVVAQLDRYIIGQSEAKKATAIAIRNRWRRQQVPSPLREDITPKNILMIGPTGVGKTEIARRMAKLVGAPFIKVRARARLCTPAGADALTR